MYALLRPLLFLLRPERAHKLTFTLLDLAARIPGLLRLVGGVKPPAGAAVDVMGLRFPTPLGLAAGMDKDARHVDALARIGFGFIEVGTLTPRPQPGNPRPRLFRLKADRALINRMGFNNGGVADAVERLRKRRPGIIVGGNIGKNKDTPNEEALKDYIACFDALYPAVDYFVVNVSSPNTPGLRALQEKGPLLEILRALQQRGIQPSTLNRSTLNPSTLNPSTLNPSTHNPSTLNPSTLNPSTLNPSTLNPSTLNPSTPQPSKHILLKIAPDLNEAQLDDIVAVVKESGIAGVIATNTTISRDGLTTPKAEVDAMGAGGVSGTPVRMRSTEVVRYLRERLPRPIVIVGVGGIDSWAAAKEKFEAGADLVQVYTGLIYEGPALVKQINRAYAAWNPVVAGDTPRMDTDEHG